MVLVDVLLCDQNRSLRGQVSPAFARAIVASLSANPTTLVELDLALSRFAKRSGERSLLEDFQPLEADSSARLSESNQGGPLVPSSGLLIDLPARVVVGQGLGFQVEAAGKVVYVEDNPDREVVTRFRIGPTWTVLPSGFEAAQIEAAGGTAAAWLRLVAQQRKVRASLLRVDDQAVLYDRVIEFLAEALLGNRFRENDDPIRDIHAEWLLTPRADLFGACPRDLLIGRLDEVDEEIAAREWEWSVLKECPPPLPADSEAYREAGHGTKEYAIYYEMIRYLLAEAWALIDGRDRFTPATLVEQLRAWRDEWLDRPEYDGIPNCTARWVIEQERRRVPWLVEEHDQMHDPDCPICRWSKQQGTPSFHQIAVCHEEEGFAFSFFDSQKQWDACIGLFKDDFDEEDHVDETLEEEQADEADCDSEKAMNDDGEGDDPADMRTYQIVMRLDGSQARIVSSVTPDPRFTTGVSASTATQTKARPEASPGIAPMFFPGGAPLAYRGTPRPKMPNLELLEPAQQVTVWHLRLVLLLIDIRDLSGQGEERKLAERALWCLHSFRDSIREHAGWMAAQYLDEVRNRVAEIQARRADLAGLCAEFAHELQLMRQASEAALHS